MARYNYRVRDHAGALSSGSLEAPNRASVVDRLRQMNYFVVAVEEHSAAPPLASADLLELFQRVRTRDLVIFNNQLATMISAGMTLISSLTVLTRQLENKKFQAVITAVRDDVERGTAFAEALAKFPAVFSPLYVNMVRAGELGGALEVILTRLAVFSEQAEEINSNIKTALTYPVLILIVSVSVVLFLVMGVFPKFEILFRNMNVELPLPTQILLVISHFLRNQWPVLLAALGFGLFAAWRYYRTEAGKYTLDRFALFIPVFGGIIKKAGIARFTRTLGTLISSGVPILHSLRMLEATLGNAALARVVTGVGDSVNRGESIAAPLQESALFPPMVGHMVAVGEESGTLDTILNKIADFYDSEVSAVIKRLSAVVEPIMLVFIGGAVGLIALSLFLPMFSLIKVMG